MDIEDGPSRLEGFALYMNSYFVGVIGLVAVRDDSIAPIWFAAGWMGAFFQPLRLSALPSCHLPRAVPGTSSGSPLRSRSCSRSCRRRSKPIPTKPSNRVTSPWQGQMYRFDGQTVAGKLGDGACRRRLCLFWRPQGGVEDSRRLGPTTFVAGIAA
jgi:hypothetical protein